MSTWNLMLALVSVITTHKISQAKKMHENGNQFVANTNPMTYKQAVSACGSMDGGPWGLPDYQKYQEEIVSLMKLNHITSIWLSWQRRTFQNWTWIDGSPLIDPLSNVYGHHCAGLAVERDGIGVMDCAGDESNIGFVCQVDKAVNDHKCPEKYFSHACIDDMIRWYIVGCDSHNWEDARSYCRRLGGDLALLDNRDKQQVVMRYLTNKKLHDECSWLYVGLRKEDWVTRDSNNVSRYADEVFWSTREPSNTNRFCSELWLDRNKAVWKTVHCQEQLPVICENYGDVVNQNIPDALPSQQESPIPAASLGAIIGLSVIITIIIVLFGIYFLIKRRKKARRGNVSEKKIEPSNLPTVVIFSSGIINLNGDPKILIQNIDWQHSNEASKDGKVLANSVLYGIKWSSKRINRVESKISDVLLLRIVNINVLDKDEKIAEIEASSILRFLTKSAINIDVVYLPKFTQRVSDPSTVAQIQGSLWTLRNDTIVLTPSKEMHNIPASEVLSVVGVVENAGESQENYLRDLDMELPGEVQDSIAGFAAYISRTFRSEILDLAHSAGMTNIFKRILLQLISSGSCDRIVPFLSIQREDISYKVIEEIIRNIKNEINFNPHHALEENNNPHMPEHVLNYEQLGETLKIKVGIINQGIDPRSEKFKNWTVKIKVGGDDRLKEDSKLLEHFITLLNRSPIPAEVLQKVIEINCFNIIDEDNRVTWKKLSDVLSELKDDIYDIVIMPVLPERPPTNNHLIYKFARTLVSHSVCICPAKVSKDRGLIEFPGEVFIAVDATKEDNAICNDDIFTETDLFIPHLRCQGSLLDFKCRVDDDIDVKPKEYADAAPYYLCTVVIDVLIKAERLGLSEEQKKKIRRSPVMHDVLKNLIKEQNNIRQPLKYNPYYDGWGILNYSGITNEQSLHQILMEAVNTQYNLWNGKNV